MQLNLECNCPVCRAHRLHPEIPEHVQETQLRLEHASRIRARRRARIVWCVVVAAVLLVAAVYALYV
jgi:hypothetical protein